MIAVKLLLLSLLFRYGYVPSRKGRGVLFFESGAGNRVVDVLLRAVSVRYPRDNIYRVSSGIVSEENDGTVLVPYLIAGKRIVRRLLTRTKADLAFIAADSKVKPWLIRSLCEKGVTVVMLGAPQNSEFRLADIDRFLIADEGAGNYLKDAGVEQERIITFNDKDGSVASKRLLQSLESIVAANRSQRKGGRSIRRWVMAVMSNGPLKFLYHCKYHQLRDLQGLRHALGKPDSILCLGSGPSSEDPRLKDVKYDALFRVNHRWLERGLYAQVDVIFTGLKSTVRACRQTNIYCFQTIASEQEMLLKCLSLPRRVHYATAERMGSVDFAAYGSYRPTNGLVMLATAVAMNPDKLIIAGVDFFQHPAGSYPGDASTPNAYTLMHDRDTELQLVLDILSRYQGELLVFGEVLEKHCYGFSNNLASEAMKTTGETRHG